MTNTFETIVVGTAMSLVAVTQAHALNTRTWISSAGTDHIGCGPIASPCRTLQYAHDQTSADGEIDVKDSAGYGSVTITKGISIIGDGSISGVLAPSNANAITINAGASDTVVLRGLTIEGAGVGTNGIVFSSGGKLDVSNCVVQNFTGNGIYIQPSAGPVSVAVAQTTASYNGNNGFYWSPSSSATSADIVVQGSTFGQNGGSGFRVIGGAPVRASLTGSIAFSNGFSGFSNGAGSNAKLYFDLCSADFNVGSGFLIGSGPGTISRSHAMGNTTFGIAASANMVSFGDNRFRDNASGSVSGALGSATLN